jgi:hypothetical protein
MGDADQQERAEESEHVWPEGNGADGDIEDMMHFEIPGC